MARASSTRLSTTMLNQLRSFSNELASNEIRSRLEAVPTERLMTADYSGSIRYNVCMDNNASKKKFIFEKMPGISLGQQNAGVKLQKANNDEELCVSVQTSEEKGYRAFDVSTTQKNVILPLKMSRLSNPFPEPVKDFLSDALSQQLGPTRN
ncbi:unnamed protein product [Acanthoscelides obtectus]|uniref:Uncharacterized protein n=1 Tax=Acanthoscelides obtectus TaxID=200917 RepID=A0A9P0KEW4_ACAOB|nr:unnamed protein product [Acanthoscelides obtectus]CAK1657593.1 hypothetical protein AOBTE_LOCUS20436 [Acanthoscelides obtectus]